MRLVATGYRVAETLHDILPMKGPSTLMGVIRFLINSCLNSQRRDYVASYLRPLALKGPRQITKKVHNTDSVTEETPLVHFSFRVVVCCVSAHNIHRS